MKQYLAKDDKGYHLLDMTNDDTCLCDNDVFGTNDQAREHFEIIGQCDELQKKEYKFKPGDKVLITKMIQPVGYGWTEPMDDTIGKYGTVMKGYDEELEDNVDVYTGYENGAFIYHKNSLELIEES